MRNYWFIGIVLVLALLTAIPLLHTRLQELQKKREQEQRASRMARIEQTIADSKEFGAAGRTYLYLREKEKHQFLSYEERAELDRAADTLGYWFERQGEKLTKRYGLVRFDKEEIDRLVGIK